jgi:hypothetical protein
MVEHSEKTFFLKAEVEVESPLIVHTLLAVLDPLVIL